MNPVPAADWANFFVAEVGASAALTGLVVVAISINLTRILAIATLPGRAAEALIILAGVLILASAGLVPAQPAAAFGAETLAIGLAMFVAAAVLQWRSPIDRKIVPRWRQALRPMLSAAASLPIVIGGGLLMGGSAGGVYWIAAGIVISLIAGVFNAWVLLIEIMR